VRALWTGGRRLKFCALAVLRLGYDRNFVCPTSSGLTAMWVQPYNGRNLASARTTTRTHLQPEFGERSLITPPAHSTMDRTLVYGAFFLAFAA